MSKYIFVQIILCLKNFLERIVGSHYPIELVQYIVTMSYTKIKINSGWSHTSAIINGKNYLWGSNKYDELGYTCSIFLDKSEKIACSPQKFEYFENVKTIQCWKKCTIALTDRADAFIWGNLSQVCFPIESNDLAYQKIPISNIKKIAIFQVNRIVTLTKNNEIHILNGTVQKYTIPGIIKIKCSLQSIFVLTTIGKLYGYGLNPYGELGLEPDLEPDKDSYLFLEFH